MSKQYRFDIFNDWLVLVVEDDPYSADIARRILERYGATIYLAENGQVGITMARELRPRFILTDIAMPVVDGWALIETLKSDRYTLEIPIIALTAHAMVGDRERALAMGCHNYLTKPLTPSSFINDLVTILVDIPELDFSPDTTNGS